MVARAAAATAMCAEPAHAKSPVIETGAAALDFRTVPPGAFATPGGTRHTGEVILAGGVILPNRARTPGAANPAVTQADIDATICRTGYTSTIRPPSAYTTALKGRQLEAGYAYRGDRATGDYEEDHLAALELSGAPSDKRNLWPEPYPAGGSSTSCCEVIGLALR